VLCLCQERSSRRSCITDRVAVAQVGNRLHLGFDVTSSDNRPLSLQHEPLRDNPLFLSSPAERGIDKKSNHNIDLKLK